MNEARSTNTSSSRLAGSPAVTSGTTPTSRPELKFVTKASDDSPGIADQYLCAR